MRRMMRLNSLLLILLFASVTWVAAQELSPLEKALKALAEKKNAVQAGEAGNTMTAQGETVAPAGNTPTVSKARQNAIRHLAESQGNTTGAFAESLSLTGTATAEAITLSWTNTGTAWADFSGYLVTKAVAGQLLAPAGPDLVIATQYRDLTVTPQDYYLYRVAALDIRGNTLVVSKSVLMQLVPAILPARPEEFKSEIEEERAKLMWKKVAKTSYDISGYLVYRAEPGSEDWKLLTPAPHNQDHYYDETGETGREYQYRVRAVDSRGQTGPASASLPGMARPRNRNSLVWMSTAYRGMGRQDRGITGDMQFTYYIGTLYGEQEPELSPLALYLDPISLWLLSADVKYTFLTEQDWPISAAAGGKASIQLFAGQQSASSGKFTFSEKSELDYAWGGYLALSRSFGNWGIHGGYSFGSLGDSIFYLSKYMQYAETEQTRNLFYAGVDFPISRRMNVALEILYPLDQELSSRQHPKLINLHVDRLLNFDVAYLHWDQGWAFLGYFNIRFTLYPMTK